MISPNTELFKDWERDNYDTWQYGNIAASLNSHLPGNLPGVTSDHTLWACAANGLIGHQSTKKTHLSIPQAL